MEHKRTDGYRLARVYLPEVQREQPKGALNMMSIWWALFFMAIGAVITHLSWMHAWRMYKSGKAEGQGITKAARQSGSVRA